MSTNNNLDSDLEHDIENGMESDGSCSPVPVKKSKKEPKKEKSATNKDGVKNDGILKPKKKPSNPRALPRPYKNLSSERLDFTILTLKERVETADNRLQTYSIRLRKLNAEFEFRKMM
jgi:hypothetical protein